MSWGPYVIFFARGHNDVRTDGFYYMLLSREGGGGGEVYYYEKRLSGIFGVWIRFSAMDYHALLWSIVWIFTRSVIKTARGGLFSSFFVSFWQSNIRKLKINKVCCICVYLYPSRAIFSCTYSLFYSKKGHVKVYDLTLHFFKFFVIISSL